jgi:hypothetical protein
MFLLIIALLFGLTLGLAWICQRLMRQQMNVLHAIDGILAFGLLMYVILPLLKRGQDFQTFSKTLG